MINTLRYAVSFPINGITLSGEHTFQPGITAVSGRNGSGKSFIREMLRYGLFGKKALRGPASDYKSLDMEQTFTVGENTYVVKRGKKELLLLEDEQLAVGADAVNKKIIEILGFGLEVFDVVCAVNQKESERLTQLTPAKRKELIDDVVGLTAQEAVETACRKQASELRREAETLARVLKAPVEPVKPDNYHPSAEIGEQLEKTKVIVAEEQRLQRIIDAVGSAPAEPRDKPVDIEALEEHEQHRVEAVARREALLASINRIPEPLFTAEQLDAAEAVNEYETELKRRGPQPDYDEQTLNEFEAILDAKDAAAKVEEVECPNCTHHFHPGVSDVQAELALKLCPLNRSQIRQQRAQIDSWATPLVRPEGDPLNKTAILDGRRALDRAAEKEALQAELDTITVPEDRSAELRAARHVAQEWAVFEAAADAYHKRVWDANEAQDALSMLEPAPGTVADLDAAFVAARIYETQLSAYTDDKVRYDDLAAEIADKENRAEGFTAGAKGLVEARRTLKAFLAPSLSRVATGLIQQMTVNAQRPLYAIEIDEDMNIVADGQDVSTFNGAHATMINLALRLALQQVLVSRVFPVFIGDEIDSDMEPTNAQTLMEAIGNLRDHLTQIILISHKQLEGADAEIVL